MTQDKETIGTILVPHDGTEMSDKALNQESRITGKSFGFSVYSYTYY